MKATPQDILTAKLFYKAAFPVMKIVLQEDPKIAAKWADTTAVVQFRAKDDEGDLLCHLKFDKGAFAVVQGEYEEKPDLELVFSSVGKMVKMFKGNLTSLPTIGSLLKGAFTKPMLLINTLMLLMQLMLMMPSNDPTDDLKKYLKVKMSLYMITTAMSTANKLGWEGIKNWTMQPDRIYQFAVGNLDKPTLACYLRVKAGNSKAGRGMYERKTPFALFHFRDINGALNVLMKKKTFVGSVEDGDVQIVGAPEYAAQLNDIMAILQDMLTKL